MVFIHHFAKGSDCYPGTVGRNSFSLSELCCSLLVLARFSLGRLPKILVVKCLCIAKPLFLVMLMKGMSSFTVKYTSGPWWV